MNNSELAAKMLQWEEMQKAADELKSEIEAAVLEIGKTQNVGNVRASYSKGRKSVNYQKAALPESRRSRRRACCHYRHVHHAES